MWKSFANGGGGFYNFAENVSKNSQIYIINIMKLKNFFLAALAAAFAFASCELIDPDTTPETPDQEQTPGDTAFSNGTPTSAVAALPEDACIHKKTETSFVLCSLIHTFASS